MKLFRRTDLLVILALVALSVAAIFIHRAASRGRAVNAEIYYRSELVMTVDLGAGVDRTFSLPQEENVVFHVFADGQIRFESSDCPDKVCVHAGKLGIAGQSAACLPNGIVLKIVPADGRNEDGPDIIVGP